MVLLTQALAEYVGVTAQRVGHVLGHHVEDASRFVAEHELLAIGGVIGILFLVFGRRRRRQ
ncbi:MAG: hypothetical protein ACREL7_10090 [Longimicrobiales bacterium]